MKNSVLKKKSMWVWIAFLSILIFGFLLRVVAIGQVPSSPDWDEAALGYNAYSILLTGRDEYGQMFPVVLRSFDDYKPALYTYLIIPFIKLFGLTVVSVRLPAVLFGTISLAVVFFIIRELFQKGIAYGRFTAGRNVLALTVMLLLSIAPWHIQFSRVAFEAQVGLSLNLLCILFFLKSFNKNFLLIFSGIFAALSIYVYQSEKVYIPLLALLLITVFYKQFFQVGKKWIGASLLISFLVILPMAVYIISNPAALNRAKGVSVFSDSTKLLDYNTQKLERNSANNDFLGLILDNRRFEYARAFTSGYLSHFEPNWLFYRGDALRHQAPYMGLLYIFEIPLILIGIYVLIFSSVKRRVKVFIFGYLLISPLPASVTYDIPHAVRTINMLPSPQIFSALGLLYVAAMICGIQYSLWKFKIKYLLLIVLFSFISFNVLYYFNQYFVQMNYYYSKAWQYGWEEAVLYAKEEAKKFDQVIVTNVSPLDQSYMFFLFYSKYDPKKYLLEGGTKSGGFATEHTAFENYIFRPINWEEDKTMKNTLFIGRPGDLPDNIGRTIYYENGEPAIVFSGRYE